MTSMTAYSSGVNKTPPGYSEATTRAMDPLSEQYRAQQFGALQPGVMDSISQLSRMARGDESYYQQLERPAFREFEGAMGQLGSRFAGMGTGGTRSSGFRLAAGGMAQDLAERLQGQRMSLQQQAMRDLMSMSGQLMNQQPYQYGLVQKPKGFWESLLPSLIQAGGTLGGGYLSSLPMASVFKAMLASQQKSEGAY